MRHFRVAWVWTLVLLLLIGCGGQNAAQPSESASPTYDAEDTIIVSAVKPQETILTATVLTTPPATAAAGCG